MKNTQYFYSEKLTRPTLRKKWGFPLRISSVNVTKSAGNCRFGHLQKKSVMENFIFCAVRVKVWTCSHFDIDSVICKVFTCWKKNLLIWKAPFFIFQNSLVIFWVFCSCHRNAPMRSIKFYLVGEFLSRKKKSGRSGCTKGNFLTGMHKPL